VTGREDFVARVERRWRVAVTSKQAIVAMSVVGGLVLWAGCQR